VKNGKTVILRPLRWEDLESVLELANKLVGERDEDPNLGIIFDQKQTRESESDWLANLLRDVELGRQLNVAAEVDGEIVGNSHVARGRSSDEKHHGVLGISILKRYRNLGIGSEIMKALLEEARKSKFRSLELEVFANNGRAIHLYEKLGFREVGRIPKKIKRGNRFIDSLIMYKKL